MFIQIYVELDDGKKQVISKQLDFRMEATPSETIDILKKEVQPIIETLIKGEY